MSVRSSRVYTAPVPKMPPGLVDLMEGLAKDVLKNNPTDVYEFCAQHMHKLLQVRDGYTKTKMTLEQKITLATNKVRERAEKRRQDYDKKMQVMQESFQDNENQYTSVNSKDIKAELYTPAKVTKISENTLSGNQIEISNLETVEENVVVLDDLKINDDIQSTSECVNETYETSVENTYTDSKNPDNQNSSLSNESPEKNLNHLTTAISLNEQENEDIPYNDQIESNGKLNQTEENIKIDTESLIQSELNQEESNNSFTESHETEKNNESLMLQGTEVEAAKNNIEPLVGENIKDEELENHDNNVILDEKIEHMDGHVIVTNDSVVQDMQDNKNEVEGTNFTNINADNNSAVELTCDSDKDLKSVTDVNYIDNKEDIVMESEENLKDQVKSDIEHTQDTKENMPIILDSSPIDDDSKSKNDEPQNNTSNTMDLETAAITIQKVFRSFLFRSKTSSIDDATNVDINLLIEDKEKKNDDNVNINIKDRRTLGLSRMDTVLQTVNEEKSLSLSTDDSSTLSSAATIIQAHVRGFLVRNKFNLNKTGSSTSGIDSDGHSVTSLDGDNDNYRKNKTILNIHIVPEGAHFMSRDESMLTSIDLSLDGSPPCSTNLHPLGYDKSERRKQLKREDAIQSVSPPSDNSGKLSEDVDSVKEMLIDNDTNSIQREQKLDADDISVDSKQDSGIDDTNEVKPILTVVNHIESVMEERNHEEAESVLKGPTLAQMTSDEMDVVTPFSHEEDTLINKENIENLSHSGEFHDVVLPTKVTRSDTSVVSGE